MRQLVTGLDPSGGSCVVDERDLALGEALPGIRVDVVFDTRENPPPSRPPGRGEFLDLGVAPGLTRWMVIEFEPGGSVAAHHTDTVDFDTVLAGSIDLTLDDGVHALAPGDCVVMNGVDHAWRAGPDGCRLSVVAIGTPPPG
jgi:quercetin dioxygenase-like cupin family protein